MAIRIETLDARRLLALATWDGGGDNTTWTNPANWAGDVLPANGDDIDITVSGPAIKVATDIHVNALTLNNREIEFQGRVTIDGTFLVKAAGYVAQISHNLVLDGAGSVLIESGGQLSMFAYPPTPVSFALLSKVPITNFGTVLVHTGSNLQGGIINYGQLDLQGSAGTVYGEIINEATGTLRALRYSYSPNSAYGGTQEIGWNRSDSGVISPAKIVNRGTIYSTRAGFLTSSELSIEPVGYIFNGLKVYINGSSVLGGRWNAINVGLHFYSTNATPLVLDSTFSMGIGTMIIHSGIAAASIQGLSPTGGLVVESGSTVTFDGDRTSWGLLRINDGGSVTLGPGNRTLAVTDLEVLGAGQLNIGDGLLVHRNQPGYLRSWVTNTTPATTPAYSPSISGTFNGSPISLEPNGNSYAVGYSRGDGLAVHYPSHTFNGETFDDNDFIFFTTLRGDVNFDRQVDFTDLLTLSQRYGQATSRGYADGNFEGNVAGSGNTGFEDLLRLAQNYGTPFVRATDAGRGSFFSKDRKPRHSPEIV